MATFNPLLNALEAIVNMMRYSRATLSALVLTSLTVVGGTAAFAADAPAAPAIAVNATIETNYTANLNKPFNHANYMYAFNSKEGQFALNLAEIKISKPVTDSSRAGFTVKLIEGEMKNSLLSEDGDNILEAYGTMLIPAGGKNITFDAGQFETHVGYETMEIGSGNFFSRGYLFSIPEPFYDAGVRAAYPVSSKLTVAGYLYNRYNGRVDNDNTDLAPGFQLAFTPSGTTSIVLNGLTSRENVPLAGAEGTVNREQSILNLIYSNQISPATKLVLEGVYRFGKDNAATKDGNDYEFYGVSGSGVFSLRGGNLGIRAEYLVDSKDTYILGADPDGSDKKGNLGSVTLSYEPKMGLFPGVRTLLEYRYDFANVKVFAGEKATDAGKKNESTITLGQVYAF